MTYLYSDCEQSSVTNNCPFSDALSDREKEHRLSVCRSVARYLWFSAGYKLRKSSLARRASLKNVSAENEISIADHLDFGIKSTLVRIVSDTYCLTYACSGWIDGTMWLNVFGFKKFPNEASALVSLRGLSQEEIRFNLETRWHCQLRQ